MRAVLIWSSTQRRPTVPSLGALKVPIDVLFLHLDSPKHGRSNVPDTVQTFVQVRCSP